jgi:hypothetical protein
MMGEEDKSEFLAWYESQKSEEPFFYTRRVLEKYRQVDVTVLREACRDFRCEFMHIGSIDLFLESIMFA